MLRVQKILVPLTLDGASPHVAQQAAWLARRFHAEIVLLHVVTPFRYPAGLLEGGHEMTARDLHAHVVERAQKSLDEALGPELDGIKVTRVLLRGEPAREIARTAREQGVDLIAMPAREGAVYPFLLGSVTAKVLHEAECPVWTGAHLEETPEREFSIRRVLCSVDLSAHSRHTVSLAAEMAAAVDATLTLVHVTGSVEIFGPGGTHVDEEWKEKVVGFAVKEIAALQKDAGTDAQVVIESGNVPRMLRRAAEQTGADVLVIGRVPGHSHLGDNGSGYWIVQESRIPVLSV